MTQITERPSLNMPGFLLVISRGRELHPGYHMLIFSL